MHRSQCILAADVIVCTPYYSLADELIRCCYLSVSRVFRADQQVLDKHNEGWQAILDSCSRVLPAYVCYCSEELIRVVVAQGVVHVLVHYALQLLLQCGQRRRAAYWWTGGQHSCFIEQ